MGRERSNIKMIDEESELSLNGKGSESQKRKGEIEL